MIWPYLTNSIQIHFILTWGLLVAPVAWGLLSTRRHRLSLLRAALGPRRGFVHMTNYGDSAVPGPGRGQKNWGWLGCSFTQRYVQ
jgi:hypothetical protein